MRLSLVIWLSALIIVVPFQELTDNLDRFPPTDQPIPILAVPIFNDCGAVNVAGMGERMVAAIGETEIGKAWIDDEVVNGD